MEINIRKSEVTKYGNEILKCSSDLSNQINKFNLVIDSINSAWDGADALKYINVMREKYLISMNELKEILDEYGDYLCRIPNVYTILDDTFASKKI